MALQGPLDPDVWTLSSIIPSNLSFSDRSRRLSRTPDSLTCLIRFDSRHWDTTPWPDAVLLHLEVPNDHPGRLISAARIQRQAHAILGNIVPLLLDAGTTMDRLSRALEYTVVPCKPAMALQDVWDSMSADSQQRMVDSVIRAIEPLQDLKPYKDHIPDMQEYLGIEGEELGGVTEHKPVGSPQYGFFTGTKKLLFVKVKDSNAASHCVNAKATSDGGIAIQSIFEDIGGVELSRSELNELDQHVVLCNNNLEPRNIRVEPTDCPYWAYAAKRWSMSGNDVDSFEEDTDDEVGEDDEDNKDDKDNKDHKNDEDDKGGDKDDKGDEGNGENEDEVLYELVAIEKWDTAGFYPFAYEFGMKDLELGIDNLSFSWYSLFKERAAALLPDRECHVKLIKALRIMKESQERVTTDDVQSRVKAKWIEREQLEMSDDIKRGWVRKEGAENLPPPSFDKDELEREVLKEMGRVG